MIVRLSRTVVHGFVGIGAPPNIVAFAFRFRPELYFEVESATVREVPEVSV